MAGTDPTVYAGEQPMGRLLEVGEVADVVAGLVLHPLPHTPKPLVV